MNETCNDRTRAKTYAVLVARFFAHDELPIDYDSAVFYWARMRFFTPLICKQDYIFLIASKIPSRKHDGFLVAALDSGFNLNLYRSTCTKYNVQCVLSARDEFDNRTFSSFRA